MRHRPLSHTLLLSLAALMFLGSCGGKTMFEETRSFHGAWNRFKTESYTVPVKNSDDFYNIYIKVLVDTARYKSSSLPLNINIYSPNDEHRMFQTHIMLRDDHGLLKGSFENGRLVIDSKIRDLFSFNGNGDYRFDIGQATHYYDIFGIESLCLHIEKADLSLPE